MMEYESHVLTDPQHEWDAICRAIDGRRRYAYRRLDVDWKKYNTDDYLFTHDTACCSVETEENGYWIKPACWELVNANGNAWTNPVLLGSFRTFVGGDNFLEHCFVKGTPVLMADGSYKNIEDVVPGDKVINHNGEEDTVLNTQTRLSSDLYRITVDGNVLVATGNHPVYVFVDGDFRWKRVDSLNPDVDRLLRVTMTASYAAGFGISKFDGEMQEVYNLEVENEHSYVAGGVAVHNCQIPALSKGKILDAIIRPVHYHSEKQDADADIFYVDLLIATSRKHTSLVERIESGKLHTLSMGCVLPGERVNMADGSTKPIVEVKVGDLVYTHRGEINEVTRCFEFDVVEVPLYRINYEKGFIELTGEHPVLIRRNGDEPRFIEVSQLETGDCIISPWCDGSERYDAYPILFVDKNYYTGKVYNLSVKEDNSYLVRGIAVHNCIANVTQCSICGRIIRDGDKNCEHLDKHLGQMVTCSDGVPRMCAELCGVCDEHGNYEDGSVAFIEQSWVEHPAFPGSVVNYFVETPEMKISREKEKDELSRLFDGNLFERLKVADVESNIALKIAREENRIDKISKRIAGKKQ